MNIILESHVKTISDDFDFDEKELSKKFELFCNYCIVSKHFFGRFNPIVVTTDEDDASIDGIAFIIDGELITTTDDAEAIFKRPKNNVSVDVIFTQIKSGEKFSKDEIANFKIGLEDFLSLNPKLPNGSFNVEALQILRIVFANLRKIRNKRPNCQVYYCTSGVYKSQREISASFGIIERHISETDYFNKVSVIPLGRGELISLYTEISEKNEAKLKLIEYFGMPAMNGIPQSYVALVNASDFIKALVEDSEGNLRESIFEENVRSFLGNKNDVNVAIQETLNSPDKKSLFSVLNNGITIVAPELTLTPNTKELDLANYQIINGCQTSTTLHENKKFLNKDVNVVVKFIESPDNEFSGDIIAATNSQSDIPKESFLGLRNKAKLVQRYFKAQNEKQAHENHIFFERRQNEYKHAGYQSTRIFDVREVARCYAAMFLDLPHNAARYVNNIFSSSGDLLFKEDDNESYYYASCLALYKYHTLINGRKINAHNYIKVRWHIIHLFKFFCSGETAIPLPNSNKAEKFALKLITTLNSENKSHIKIFERCQKVIDTIGFPTSDELKRSKFSAEIMAEAIKSVKKTPKK
ncbi:AIPR family protein [Ectopseudomonas hydrolytica]|uniref:AIPR family protein n=1 Tax=Ectopseudomonas hydrolytica TaxID=2493633 RepID=UPI00376F2C3C